MYKHWNDMYSPGIGKTDTKFRCLSQCVYKSRTSTVFTVSSLTQMQDRLFVLHTCNNANYMVLKGCQIDYGWIKEVTIIVG